MPYVIWTEIRKPVRWHLTGGFPLAAQRNGVTPVWASEIEAFPIEVTKIRFPDMLHVGDITKIKGAELMPVDVVCGGSPCQDLSLANIKRAGLQGERSSLFLEQIRVIKEMRNHEYSQGRAADTIRPRYMVWENVPGAFSSADGEDFRTVLEETCRIVDDTVSIPRPPEGVWKPAGAILGDQFSVAWRVYDAQYWGVAQRRRRIFLVADFRGHSAPEVLFKQGGLFGSAPEGEETRQGTTSNPERCIALSGETVARTITARGDSSPCVDRGQNVVLVERPHVFSQQRSDEYLHNEVTSTQSARQYKDSTDLVCEPIVFGQAQYAAYGEGVTALRAQGGDCGGGSENLCVAQLYDMSHTDEVIRPCSPGTSPTLNARMGTGGNQVPIMIDRSVAQVNSVDCHNLCDAEDLSGTLQSKRRGGYSLNYQNPVRIGYAVRRLTPIECERLMGFPAGWTDIPGASDSARYKALGNSVAIPCVEHVLRGIAHFLERT